MFFKGKKSTVTQLLISNQKFNAETQVTRSCVTVLVIFNTFPSSGITDGVQLDSNRAVAYAGFFNGRGFSDVTSW